MTTMMGGKIEERIFISGHLMLDCPILRRKTRRDLYWSPVRGEYLTTRTTDYWHETTVRMTVPMISGDGFLVRELVRKSGLSSTSWAKVHDMEDRVVRRMMAGKLELTAEQRQVLLAEFLAARISSTDRG